MVMESKTTSKTSSLKALLLRAWRERWSDIQWGIHIKTVLPRGVSGDVYNLADCILQQATVGAGANQLVLSYLQHSLAAHLVSHAAVLQRLSKYSQFTKMHCLLDLLEFLENMLPGVTCSGKPEETVLATAILSTALWLLSILQEGKPTTFYKAGELFQKLLTEDFYVSMICLAKYNDPELFTEASSKCTELLTSLLDDGNEVTKYVRKLENIDVNILSLPIISEKWPGSLIQCWLEIKFTGDPCASTSSLEEQLRIFQRLKGFSDARLYAELMRASLLALHNVIQTSQSQWGAFAFLKVPQLLLKLTDKQDSSNVVSAVELMLQHSPLLDSLDANMPTACSTLKNLLDQLVKLRLLTDGQVKHLLEKRKIPTNLNLDNSPGIPKVILCAELTLDGVLKTLQTDYHKNQEAILSMLHQVLTGKSFELILAVATVQGSLKSLVKRLIFFNELSKSGGDVAKSQGFDISFIMLISIVQNYGASTVLDSDGDSLFEQWVKSCMVEKRKPKAHEQILRLSDPKIVEVLLKQFNEGESDVKPPLKWQDVLFNIPKVMHEVLIAWEQGALLPVDVKRILDAVRGKMCCMPLVAAAWLCSYMRTAPQDTILKPANMVQQLSVTPATEEEGLRDRWNLTSEIIRRMQWDVQLHAPSKSSQHLVSRQPAAEQLQNAWTRGISRGWSDLESAKTLHCLVDTAKPRWLVSAVVQELLKLRYRDRLQRGVDLALAMFHVDIVSCTIELLSHVLPQLLYNNIQADTLTEPQLPALATLTSYCVYTAWDALQKNSDTDPAPTKIPKMEPGVQEEPHTSSQLIFYLQQLLTMFDSAVQEGHITQQTYFGFQLIKSLVEGKTSSADAILSAIPPALISDLLRTLPELFSYSMLVHLHDVSSNSGRINMAKDLCLLRNYLRNNS